MILKNETKKVRRNIRRNQGISVAPWRGMEENEVLRYLYDEANGLCLI